MACLLLVRICMPPLEKKLNEDRTWTLCVETYCNVYLQAIVDYGHGHFNILLAFKYLIIVSLV